KEAHEIDGGAARRYERWNVHRERWQARMIDVLVTHSDAHRRRMADETGLPTDRIRLIPLSVPTFPEYVRPPRPPGPPTVVYLGRLEHRKGTVELLQAVPRVLERVPDARFVLIGQDRPHCSGGRAHAEYLAQDFPPHVRQAVTLAGRLPQAEVDRALQTADLFVAPSRYESFGLIFLEAMRWGTPVVGTTAGGIPEVVEHGKSGWLVTPEAPDALAAAIVRLLTTPDLRASLGAEGRRRAETEFGVETMVRRMEEVYAEAIARKRGGR
ncbi:MAG: glycosyltransferase family 4 protein, partial [Gemmataceae bacterium]